MSPRKAKPPAPPAPPAPPPPPPPKPDPERARHDREVDDELHRIYDETGEAKSDMTKLDQARHSTLKKVLVGMMVFFAVLAAVSWAGFFFFSPGATKFGGEEVKLDLEGPTEAKSGDVVTYGVHYRNDEKIALGTASIELRVPKAFHVVSTDPSNDGSTWQVGAIPPGHDGLITIKGYYLAADGKDLDMQAILTYRPADFNSEFQKVSTKGVSVKGSVLELTATGPAKVLPGDKVELTFAYKNDGQAAYDGLKLRADYPSTFIPESATPASADDQHKEWDVGSLAPGAEGKIVVDGSFASDAEGSLDLKGTLGFLGDGDEFQPQTEATFTTEVLKGDLVTALILNGKPDAQPLRFGDMLRYTVTYKNTGTVPLQDVQLAVTLQDSPQGKLVQWNNLSDKAHGVRTDGTITWTKKQIPSLGTIGADDEGTIEFEVPFIGAPLPGVTGADYQVTSWLEATVGTIEGSQVDRTTKTPPIVSKAVSDTALAAEARYFNADNIPVGTGPLPPKVGQATTYRINWTVTNALHDLTDIKVSAQLPDNVTWTGLSNVDAGDLKFDAADGKMVWTLNWMPTTIKKLTVSFDVSLTPTADQLGKIPTLVEGSILEAVDKVNGYPVLLSAEPLSTSLDNDEGAAGKGRVE